MTTNAEIGRRVTALQFATGAGLPPDLTLDAARKYLAFIEGREELPREWMVKSLNRALVASMPKKPAAKKAAPRKASK